ncbi:MAG TPA: GerMN domain-containing protein [Candidatus Baltobacteraceae bacterium]|nr:GerMN domain-containing protein [Candidatus Baltobacteraceae bacterium]
MRTSRAFYWIILLVIAALASWYFTTHGRSPIGDHITVYYTKVDGTTEVPWTVSMRPQLSGESVAEHLRNTVLYAATQAVAGPPGGVSAIRFPQGTHLLSAGVNDSTATVDLSQEVKNQSSGVLGESGAFKSLVWTLTALPGITQVAVRVQGQTLDTLPGGHLELDEPLRRSDW